jgi:hypothetical protein
VGDEKALIALVNDYLPVFRSCFFFYKEIGNFEKKSGKFCLRNGRETLKQKGVLSQIRREERLSNGPA